MATATKTPVEELENELTNLMSKSMEVGPIAWYVDYIVHVEHEVGHKFTDQEIYKTWLNVADDQVDSWISNAMETPDSEWSAEERESSIRRYESMRPSTIRRKELAKKFGE